MSRTKHHKEQKNQHIGEDLWSRRAGMGHAAYNAFNKWLTRRIERAMGKQELAKIKKLPDDV